MEEKKKKIVFPVIALIFVAILVIALGTYAYWQITRKQTNRNVVGTACLNITFTNESNDILLENAWPTSDSDGENLTPYEFTITNTCNTPVNYTVALESIEDQSANNAYLDYNYIRVKLNNETTATYGALTDLTDDINQGYTIRDTREITHHTLAANDHITYELRLWVKEDTPLQNQDESYNTQKYFFGKIKVIAGQNIEGDDPLEACYTIDNEGTITDYDLSCGFVATVPASVGGIQVKKIGYNAFRGDSYSVHSSNAGETAFTMELSTAFVNSAMSGGQTPITSDDIWFVKYNDVSDTTIEDFFDKSSVSEDETMMMIFGLLNANNVEFEDIRIYNSTSTDKPNLGLALALGIEDDGNTVTYPYTAHIMSSNLQPIDEPQIQIFEVDISGANYLQEIEYPGSYGNGESALSGVLIKGFPNTTSILNSAYQIVYFDNLVIPNSVTSIGDGAFRYSTINSLTLGNNITTIGNDAFIDYTGTGKDLIIPNSVISIGNYAFSGGNSSGAKGFNGRYLEIGNNVQSIGDYAFYHYVGTGQNLVIPNSVTTIGGHAFEHFNGESLTIGDGVEIINSDTFEDFNGTSLVLGSGLTTLEPYAFRNYVGAGQTVTIPSGVTFDYSAEVRPVFQNFVGNFQVYDQSLCDHMAYLSSQAASCTVIGS